MDFSAGRIDFINTVPVYAGVEQLPRSLLLRDETGEKRGRGAFGEAYGQFFDVASWVEKDYYGRIGKARRLWNRFEEASLSFQPFLDSYIKAKWAESPDLVRELLTRRLYGAVEQALAEARGLLAASSPSSLPQGR